MKDIADLWKEAVARIDVKARTRLQAERGYSPEFCLWLEEQNLIGIFKGGWAFANCDSTGTVISIHYRTNDGTWRYYPEQRQVHPTVIRGTAAEIKSCHVFESPWDAFSILDRLQIYQRDDFLCIVTRGAENGRLISEVSIPRVPVLLWAQDDGMTEEHRHTPLENRPSSHWINSVKHAHNGVAELRVLLPPIGFKDWCDYTRSNDATAESIRRRLEQTKPEPEPEVDFEYSAKDDDGEEEQIHTFAIKLLAPIQAQMVEATAESIRVHPNLPAIATLGAVSAAIGRGLYAKSGPNQTICDNLFILGSAISGEGKSEGSRPLVAPLINKNFNRIDYYQQIERPSLLSRQRLYLKEVTSIESLLYGRKKDTLSTADKKALRDRHQDLLTMLDDLNDRLVEPAMLTEDCTQEMMGVLMARNNEQLFSFSADAAKAIDNLEGLYNKLSCRKITSWCIVSAAILAAFTGSAGRQLTCNTLA
jgi:dsDNA-binding SOS-regulon protein